MSLQHQDAAGIAKCFQVSDNTKVLMTLNYLIIYAKQDNA